MLHVIFHASVLFSVGLELGSIVASETLIYRHRPLYDGAFHHQCTVGLCAHAPIDHIELPIHQFDSGDPLGMNTATRIEIRQIPLLGEPRAMGMPAN
jgi:hypothetical protein